jgi:hypothetical protein
MVSDRVRVRNRFRVRDRVRDSNIAEDTVTKGLGEKVLLSFYIT